MTWQNYSDKFTQLSMREQVLVALTGIIAIVFILYFYVINGTFHQLSFEQRQNSKLINENKQLVATINDLKNALRRDPNEQLKVQIHNYQHKLTSIDQSLAILTSKLVDPIQMRAALEQLLHLQKGVKLLSFEVESAQPILENEKSTNKKQIINQKNAVKNIAKPQVLTGLYRHPIKLKLSGSYFQLRDYLRQLERLPWKFFWEKFDYQLKKYPTSELNIEIYSLSLKKEFVGV